MTKLPETVVDKQLKERTELTHSRIGAPQRESILAAGLALQQAGVVDAKVDVKADARRPDRRPGAAADELIGSREPRSRNVIAVAPALSRGP